MMNIEVLMSCMHQSDISIISRTNIKSDTLLVNQCNKNGSNQYILDGSKSIVRVISSTDRGLSKSRNMALKNATGDLCLICDDDEILYDNYVCQIQKAFVEHPEADVIAFKIDNAGKVYPKNEKKLNYLTVLKVASWQIAFRRKSIIDNNIEFDETLGSGVSKAGGEENMFLYDCLKKGLTIYFVPLSIGRMIEGESQWFHGYSQEYFYDRGIFTKKLMGTFAATLYAAYYLIFKNSLYRKDISFFKALKFIIQGIYE